MPVHGTFDTGLGTGIRLFVFLILTQQTLCNQYGNSTSSYICY